jgi:hypothetical protein
MPKKAQTEAEPEEPIDEEKRELERRRRTARRAGLGTIDADLFAVGDTSIAILRLCVKQGATVEQIRKICL